MSEPAFRCRPATRDDARDIVSFQLLMAKETEDLQLDPETVVQGVASVFDHPEKGSYQVAEAEGEVIASMMLIPEWSDWRNGTVLWIHSVYVVPKWRKHGVFRALYAQQKERVETDPTLRGLRLFVDRSNRPAQEVYRAVGMSDEHYLLFEWLKS